MDERFTDYLRRQADGIMQAQHSHPFVRGIGSGTLDLARLKKSWVFWKARALVRNFNECGTNTATE